MWLTGPAALQIANRARLSPDRAASSSWLNPASSLWRRDHKPTSVQASPSAVMTPPAETA